ncbi:MAG TPA: hypothetical protein EYP85_14995 [Armatimonadetes bacterium]|nr:hypothetical protein [Armatimonadota bacterium]
MRLSRTYTFAERVRVLRLEAADGELTLGRVCEAERLHRINYEVGEMVHIAEQAQVLEVELPVTAENRDWLWSHANQPLRVEVQRPAEGGKIAWYHGVLASAGILLLRLPLEPPSLTKPISIGFRQR